MFRFTIRDVLWLTVVVALTVGWVLDRSRFDKSNRRNELKVNVLIGMLEHTHDMLDATDPGWRERFRHYSP